MELLTEDLKAKPFLRWAGGKRWLLKYLNEVDFSNINNYFEPFVGGGSVFFNFSNYSKANISDLNEDLIETYIALRDDLENVISVLREFNNTEIEYYNIRKKTFKTSCERAAKFLFLNKTSFNGIYRVNKKGEFNVPYGFRKNVDLIDKNNLQIVCEKLQGVNINSNDFESILHEIKPNDLIFLDPPYTVAHENNGFIHYNQKIFLLEDQVRLSEFIMKIKEIGAFYILTNARHDEILKIYNKIDQPQILSRSSTIGGKNAKRELINEYVFTNYF